MSGCGKYTCADEMCRGLARCMKKVLVIVNIPGRMSENNIRRAEAGEEADSGEGTSTIYQGTRARLLSAVLQTKKKET